MRESVLFGRYRLLEPAGSGGSAQVWRALDTATGDVVAVKRLHPIVFADPNARTRLERESRALEALQHPNVVAYRDLHLEDDEAALVLDYVDGIALDDRLASGPPLALGETATIVRDVAAALTAAHAVGIVHRDVKPGNIILARDGRALLTDFGIAADGADDATAALTATGTIVGTFRYMAPEQLRGTPAAPVTDQYALAAVAYELLTGRPPYTATTPVALAEAQGAPPPRMPGVRPELEAAVLRGLSPDPNERYPDVAAFAGAVDAALRASPASADTDVAAVVARPGPVEPAVVGGPALAAVLARSPLTPDPPREGVRVVSRSRRATPRWAPAAAVASVLLGGALVVAAMSGDPGGNDRAVEAAAPTVTATPDTAPATSQPPAVPVRNEGGDDKKDDEKKDEEKGEGDKKDEQKKDDEKKDEEKKDEEKDKDGGG